MLESEGARETILRDWIMMIACNSWGPSILVKRRFKFQPRTASAAGRSQFVGIVCGYELLSSSRETAWWPTSSFEPDELKKKQFEFYDFW